MKKQNIVHDEGKEKVVVMKKGKERSQQDSNGRGNETKKEEVK